MAGRSYSDGQLLFNKGDRVTELIEEWGNERIYLSPCSPDFNSIEEALAKLKDLLRKSRLAHS